MWTPASNRDSRSSSNSGAATPSWMTAQRTQRRGGTARKVYGRRGSSSSSVASAVRTGRGVGGGAAPRYSITTSSVASVLDFDDGEDDNEDNTTAIKDDDENGTLGTNEDDDHDGSKKKHDGRFDEQRFVSEARRAVSSSSSLLSTKSRRGLPPIRGGPAGRCEGVRNMSNSIIDDEVLVQQQNQQHVNVSKKNRPNVPRPPRPEYHRSHSSPDVRSSSNATTESVNEYESTKVMLSPIPSSNERESKSSGASSSSSIMFEENVHPNDVTETPVHIVSSSRNGVSSEGLSSLSSSSVNVSSMPQPTPGTRRSTRLQSARKDNSATMTIGGLTSSSLFSIGSTNKPLSGVTTRSNPRKRPTIDVTVGKPSPPKIMALRVVGTSSSTFSSSGTSTSNGSFLSSTSRSCRNESFSSLARQNTCVRQWAHTRSESMVSSSFNTGIGTPSVRQRCFSDSGNMSGMKSVYSSPDFMVSSATNMSTGSASSRKKRRTPIDEMLESEQQRARTRSRGDDLLSPPPFVLDYAIDEFMPQPGVSLRNAISEPPATSLFGSPHEFVSILPSRDVMSEPPTSLFSSPPTTSMIGIGYDNRDDEKTNSRLSYKNNESMMSTGSDDDMSSNSTTSEDESDEVMDESNTTRELTDLQVFEGTSYEDFKFLTRALQKWSQSKQGRGASMGLNTGCLIAVPPDWTFEHRARFARWVATAFGFRIGSVGGAGGSFLRCSDAQGKGVLERLLRILKEYKAGKLVLSTIQTSALSTTSKSTSKEINPKEKLPDKPRLQGSTSPFCDELVGDLLADDMKRVTINEKKPAKKKKKSGSPSVPNFIRSMTLQPLAKKIRDTAKPILNHLSPGIGLSPARRLSGGPPPRLSSEGAIRGSDLTNHLHCMGSPTSMPMRFPGKFRERASRALLPTSRPSTDSLRRSSFERPLQQSTSKPFESPHPRNNWIAPQETPTLRQTVISCLETPMPKQADNWGSRPVLGKDWGESVYCCKDAIDACNQIFANSWFTSDFCDNEDLSSEYHLSLNEDETSSLLPFYDSEMHKLTPILSQNQDDDDDSEVASINTDSVEDDDFLTEMTSRTTRFARCDSVGASALDLLHLDDNRNNNNGTVSVEHDRRRTLKLRKYARMSICVAAATDLIQHKLKPELKQCYRLSATPTKRRSSLDVSPINSIIESPAFTHVLSFLSERDLMETASLVSTRFADFAAEALGNLMLLSVGCDPWPSGRTLGIPRDDYELSLEGANDQKPRGHLPYAKSLLKEWSHIMRQFPWAQFISDGAFKKVFKVWNHRCGSYEAISVMDIDEIEQTGNLNLVGTELAVSAILSSVARRNICPNFVITHGVFKCAHEPLATLWGCRDECAPRGITFDGQNQSFGNAQSAPREFGNYQYIRMELCDNGDIEQFIRNHSDKMLTPQECRNLLFQMAFALHVAADRFGLKHYDVKLLNFLLQTANDPTIPLEDHPHVVLRYGIGSHVFRLRMHPSTALIAKLADYGTSVMRTETDGQPISIGQFTTIENSPPDYLILGNAAKQGYGHDCFGLGLCMLHLFTGHCPYEEILNEVVCPANLKGKLRSIWKQKTHDVIYSVMLESDEDGEEIESPTLFDTLYRFLVLFGIPKKQFDIKTNGKVWRAINSTLLPPKRHKSKKCPDTDIFARDRRQFSLSEGINSTIANARQRLNKLDGAMELLLALVSFDPKTRATPLDVLNSRFMADLIETESSYYCQNDIVKSYTAYSTN